VSYILDALRKSEARRRMGQAPGLDDAHSDGDSRRGRRRTGRFVVVGISVLAVVAVAGVAFVNRDLIEQRVAGLGSEQPAAPAGEQPIEPVLPVGSDQDEDQRDEPARSAGRRQAQVESETDRPGPDGQQRERVLSDPDEIEAELARRIAEDEHDEALAQQHQDTERESRRVRRAPETRVAAPVQRQREAPEGEELARSEEIERRLREIEARQRRQEAEAEVAQTAPERPERGSPAPAADEEPVEPIELARAATPQPQAETWRPGGPEYVRVWELPLSIRRDLPELKLSIHVYSRDEQRRFVLVNGQRFTDGDTISSGVRLAEIRPEGAVIDYRNYRFLLEP
jgi:general secretion pathway protein B